MPWIIVMLLLIVGEPFLAFGLAFLIIVWGDAEYCDTTWILHGTTTIVPPWGQFAYYDENKKD
jgi:hypothetical protein